MASGFADRFSKFPTAVRPDSYTPVGPQPQSTAAPAPAPVPPSEISLLPIWNFPPTQWENIDQLAYGLLPAIGSTVIILSYTVPAGRNGLIQKVANNFVGGGWTAGTGDLIWRILVDGTPPPGASSYNNILDSLGAIASPTKIAGFRIYENQVITVIAFNNPAGPDGGVVVAGQRVGARLAGYLYPREYEKDNIWV
jgi:hypothetical protein